MMLQVSKSLTAIIVTLCAAIGAVAQELSAPEPQPATIIGTVVDLTGSVVPGSTVRLECPGSNYDRLAITQDNGFFKLDDVKPATPCHLIVTADGFAKWTSDEIVLAPSRYFIQTGINLRVATVQVAVNVVPTEELALQQVRQEEQQRIVGFIPNFYVAYDQNTAPLTPKLKFHLATKFLTDPITTIGFLLNSSIYQAVGYPSYGQGFRGYGQRLGATFAGGYTKILVGDAILPSLLHQDPRYFYQGTGTRKSRLLHALSSPFVLRGDDGHHEINFSDIGGDLASGAIANAYYPSKDRGAKLVLTSALIGAGGRAANAIAQEFLLRKFTSRHGKKNHP